MRNEGFVCMSCGYSAEAASSEAALAICPNCSTGMGRELVRERVDVRHRTFKNNMRLRFTGTSGEYFRIWIVNTFLTIVTLGIYAAWAKVRTRQYFYSNLILDGHSFDYTANPVAILKGYLIVGGGMGLYYAFQAYNPIYSLAVLGLFFLVFPLLVYKSLRFANHNTAYRNIRFRFLGTLGESYRTYLLYPLLTPFTLGLILPYWAFRKKKYFFDNSAYGTTKNSFDGSPRSFYKIYLLLGLAVFVIFIFVTVFGSFMAGAFLPLIKGDVPVDQKKPGWEIMAFGFLIYVVMLAVVTFLQQYLYAWETNYCFTHSTFGNIRIKSFLKGGRLFWIRFTNIIAIIFSVGFLIPWAKVRRMRYIVDNVIVLSDGNMDDFTAASEPDESAYGDAASDIFDFEIGL